MAHPTPFFSGCLAAREGRYNHNPRFCQQCSWPQLPEGQELVLVTFWVGPLDMGNWPPLCSAAHEPDQPRVAAACAILLR
jgi:hypothetical protein